MCRRRLSRVQLYGFVHRKLRVHLVCPSDCPKIRNGYMVQQQKHSSSEFAPSLCHPHCIHVHGRFGHHGKVYAHSKVRGSAKGVFLVVVFVVQTWVLVLIRPFLYNSMKSARHHNPSSPIHIIYMGSKDITFLNWLRDFSVIVHPHAPAWLPLINTMFHNGDIKKSHLFEVRECCR